MTLVDVAALIAAAGLCTVIAGVTAGSAANPRETARQVKESSQLRGIGQSLILWANQNRDRYPLPSDLDRQDETVTASGHAKNTTAAIYSILIFNGSVPVEMFLSPLENNERIKVDDDYMYSDPKTAVNPQRALWDPAFSADFTNDKIGNTSFAHQQPTATERGKEHWRANYNATSVAVMARGPKVTKVEKQEPEKGAAQYLATLDNPKSNTLTWYSGKRSGSWSGNIAYGDNHVAFSEMLLKSQGAEKPHLVHGWEEGFSRKGAPDLPFFDEADALANNFAGIFTVAGEKPEDFAAIWD